MAKAVGGTLDIVVNNAAIRPHKPFLEMDEGFWHNVISVDMHSAFYTGQAFVPGMVEKGWGRVVNLTSQSLRAPIPVLGLSNSFKSYQR